MSRLSSTACKSHLATWLACVAMLMAALAPSITRALEAGHAAPTLWTTLCSASGSRLVAIDVGTSDDGSQGQRNDGHAASCGYCLLAQVLAPPPAEATVGRLPAPAEAAPSLAEHSFTPRFAWTVAYSRGPPAVS